jgi:hypothetical protein
MGKVSASAGKSARKAHQPKHGAGHDHHMQSGDGEDVEQAGIAHRLVDFVGDAGALAGDERSRDLAPLAGQGCANAGADPAS